LGFDETSKVCILDLDLQFGDVALFIDIVPKVTIADLVKNIDHMDSGVLNKYLINYRENVKVLAAPARPEQAGEVTAAHVSAIIKQLQYNYDYIIVDTVPLFNDITFSILETSNLIMVAASQDLPTLKNVKLFLEIFGSLQFPPEKIKVVLNWANSIGGMTIQDSENLLQRKFLSFMPSDGKTVVTAVNQGVPFVISNPNTPVAQTLLKMTNYIISGDEEYINSPAKRPVVTKKTTAVTQPVKQGNRKKTGFSLNNLFWFSR